ncbi:MAG: histidine-type phosphatase, partial [Lachnospiraceae bacterium]|nr:histidine-type phosphatase [Lachnospiraceae bacterium]
AEEKGLIPHDYQPDADSGEVRFIANGFQRTIATTNNFISGMLPASDIKATVNVPLGQVDPIFNFNLNFYSDSYNEAIKEQVQEIYKLSDSESETAIKLQKGYDKLMEVLDFEESESYKDGSATKFKAEDLDTGISESLSYTIDDNSYKAWMASDALLMQYYEEPDILKAAMGHKISYEDWASIAYVKDTIQKIVFATPLLAVNYSHNTLQEIRKELNTDERKFSFICGHDTNIGVILSTLNALDMDTPGNFEAIPIGSKIVFEVWEGEDSKQYISARFVYATTDQIRNLQMINSKNPPVSYYLTFENIEKNEDGMYNFEDFMTLFDNADAEYEAVKSKYIEGPDTGYTPDTSDTQATPAA